MYAAEYQGSEVLDSLMLTKPLKEAMRLPQCYEGYTSDGADVQTAAYSIGDAAKRLAPHGVDVTTIHKVSWARATDVTREIAEAMERDDEA